MAKTDYHLANYPRKTVSEIRKLVERADFGGLQAISQHYLRNAFYDVRFSLGNDWGIHGACPVEILHSLYLGIFKYIRDIFFAELGKDSLSAKAINGLAKVYCKLFQRQSDRSIPPTHFSKGIKEGKLMAKEYRGVLLIMLVLVRSTKGSQILTRSRKGRFKANTKKDNWILLLETLLEWDAYLNEEEMLLKDVKRLKRKHQYIMYLIRTIAKRTKGMGLKIMKFHSILHMHEDMLQFGVPLEFDTAANESHHKESKQAAKLTQRAALTFNYQTAVRLWEFKILDLAMHEIEAGVGPWEYFQPFEESDDEENNDMEVSTEVRAKTKTDDTQITVGREEEDGSTYFKMGGRSKFKDKARWNSELVDFLVGLQDGLSGHLATEFLPIFTRHKREGAIFHGHPQYRGKGPWKDWVWVNWRGYGRLPCHIWCFVVVDDAPTGNNTLHYGGVNVRKGVYAVVESSSLEENQDEVSKSDLLMPIRKDVEVDVDGNITKRNFYLAETEAFDRPCCVVPDIGGPTNRYFVVKSRNEWKEEFLKWVRDEHIIDDMDPFSEDEDPSDEEEGISEEEEAVDRSVDVSMEEEDE
jgi:hypothetical protein